MRPGCIITVALLAVFACAVATARAGSIAINFYDGNTGGNQYMSPSASGGKTGSEQINWNNVLGVGGTFYGAIDSSGATLPTPLRVVKVQGANDSVWGPPDWGTSATAPYCRSGAGRNGVQNSDPYHYVYDIPYTDYKVYVWTIGGLAMAGGDPGIPDETYTISGATPGWPLYIGGVPANGLQQVSGGFGICAIQIVPGRPAVDNDSGASFSTDGMLAGLRGTLLSDGVGDAKVWVYWGPTDGVTNKTSWTNCCYLGTNTALLPASYTNVVRPLGLNMTNYYRYYASNSAGGVWASSTTNFKSQGGTAFIVR
jgi:hypothetical protein